MSLTSLFVSLLFIAVKLVSSNGSVYSLDSSYSNGRGDNYTVDAVDVLDLESTSGGDLNYTLDLFDNSSWEGLETTLPSVSTTLTAPTIQPYRAKIVTIFIKSIPLKSVYDQQLTKHAIDIAVEKVQSLYPGIQFEVTHRTGYNKCDLNFAGGLAAEEHLHYGPVSLFVGPGCPSALDSVARLASYWNIPICTGGGLSPEFEDRTIFSTLIRMTVTTKGISGTFMKLMAYFDWHHVTILTDVKHPISVLFRDALEEVFVEHRYNGVKAKFEDFIHRKGVNDYTELLLKAKQSSRIVIILARGDTVRDILISGHRLDMGSGQYAFLGVELFESRRFFGNFNWMVPYDYRNEAARKMYESFMIVSMSVPNTPKFGHFKSEVIGRAYHEVGVEFERAAVSAMIAGFHDCVLMYANILNKTLAEDGDPTDGFSMSRKLWNSTFRSGVHDEIYINENGDRVVDFDLNDFDPESGEMIPVAHYLDRSDSFTVLEEPHWPGADLKPPVDVPKCGFDGKDCHETTTTTNKKMIFLWVFTSILIVLCLPAVYCFYKRLQYQREVNNFWWKIDFDEIHFMDKSTNSTTSSQQGLACEVVLPGAVDGIRTDSGQSRKPCGARLTSFQTAFKRNLQLEGTTGTRIATYRNMKVVIKVLKMQKLTISCQIQNELKLIRNLNHENLIRVIGLCVNEPNYCLVTELCPRGNLQDLIVNETFHLDWSFRYSIINDVVEGMGFIHGSPIQYHGRLKSSNCLIDSHFVVKLSDFGLNFLYQTHQEEVNPRSLLWTAPEHLRLKSRSGSQKGDVYSFAIILQETMTRSEPFECEPMLFNPSTMTTTKASLNPEEVVNLVRMGLDPPFRPFLSQVGDDVPKELVELVNKCWRENPIERPGLPCIKLVLKKLSKSFGSRNLLDNLLKRMERYTDNLEQLVEEKTSALVEEKKRSDELLNELLPKYVVKQLKAGNQVQPEHFDCVTISFADIVGFTKISAKSNPFQVIDLLNDLYSSFDAIINLHDVYKVETIGDAYMVVSGVPVRNGNDHVKEVARMSLALLDKILAYKVKHLPGHTLQLRIGVHSGPCAAGVVGMKMPRYCLFGDSVNTASRMESHGEAMKIHISEETKLLLDTFNSFQVMKRGQVDVKGKGLMTTYWLLKENS